jgi:3',5'-cyclic AMP phosphodiesterase CpdA
MKIMLISDIHTSEHFNRNPKPVRYEDIEAFGKDDVICVAGDVSDGPRGMNWFLKMLREQTDATVLAVMGNHDFYYRTLTMDTISQAREGLPERVRVLENETHVIGDVRILGCTLWTDADRGRLAGNALAMQDYELIHASPERQLEDGAIFIDAVDTMDFNEKSKDWLATELAKPFEGKTVVMTHHAPSFRSQHKKYADSPLSCFFCCDMHYLIEEYEPDYWLHGHLHDPVGYVIGRKTKVRSNPHGYADERHRMGEYVPLVIEL